MTELQDQFAHVVGQVFVARVILRDKPGDLEASRNMTEAYMFLSGMLAVLQRPTQMSSLDRAVIDSIKTWADQEVDGSHIEWRPK